MGIFIRLLLLRNMKFLEAYASSEVGKETGTGANSLLAAWGFDLGGRHFGLTTYPLLSDAQWAWGGRKAYQCVRGPAGECQPDCLGSRLSPAASWLCDPGSVTKPLCFLICKEGSRILTGLISSGSCPEGTDE